jgi:hypothetical protein
MVFRGYHSVNAALAPGMLVVNRVGNKVLFSWASTTAANIGDGALVQFRFRANAGISTTLNWDTQTPGNCEYSDVNGAVIASFYNPSNVSVSATALVVNAGNDVTIAPGGSTQLNGTKTGGTAPFTYLWTPSAGLSNPAILNPIASPSVTTTYLLTVNGSGCSGSDPVTVTVSSTVPANRNLQNIVISNGQTQCYDATQTITVAGNGTSFLVQNGGSVTLIAGNNIRLLPGTTVQNGGYLNGYITTTAAYCGSKFINEPEGNPAGGDEASAFREGSLFRIFPNPTTGEFTLELSSEGDATAAMVTIYGPMGTPIRQTTLTGTDKDRFSLSGYPEGIYFISLVRGDRTETQKIIRTR